jgi:hypothetical protein
VQFERQSRRSVGIRHHLDVNTRNGLGFDRRVRCPGFARYFKGSIGSSTATLDVASGYGVEESGPITGTITNTAARSANDPSQSKDARRYYRLQMEAYMQQKMRQAFQLAVKQTPSSATTTKREG